MLLMMAVLIGFVVFALIICQNNFLLSYSSGVVATVYQEPLLPKWKRQITKPLEPFFGLQGDKKR